MGATCWRPKATGAVTRTVPCANADYVVTGIRDAALLPAIIVMALALGALMLAWRREGR